MLPTGMPLDPFLGLSTINGPLSHLGRGLRARRENRTRAPDVLTLIDRGPSPIVSRDGATA